MAECERSDEVQSALRNGGFDEDGLQNIADSITSSNLGMNRFRTATALHTRFVKNGGKNCDKTDTGGHMALGDGNDLLDVRKHDKVEKPKSSALYADASLL